MRILVTGASGFIGTNLIAHLNRQGVRDLMNIDLAPPLMSEHEIFWRKADVRDGVDVAAAVGLFRPTHIIHLAAIATFYAGKHALEATNAAGTANILDAAVTQVPTSRILVTSTQYVNGPGSPFNNDLEFSPVNDYGQSKVDAELITRQDKYAGLDWIITRPTNIWGAFHPRFPTEIWKYVRRGLYIHPGHVPIIRTYGYVGNICRQIDILLKAPVERVRHRVFYLTDPPLDSYDFLNRFSFALRGRKLPRAPYSVMKLLAVMGDLAQVVGLPAPFRSDRLKRMMSAHEARYEKLWEEFDYKPETLDEAIELTKAWLKQTFPSVY